MTIDLADGGFIHLRWSSLTIHFQGLGFYFGWFPELDLIGAQVTFFEWADDMSHLVPFRLQILYFLFAIHLDKN